MMNQSWDGQYFERLLKEHNYIAAYQYVKTNHVEEPERSEYAGRIVVAVVEELSRVNRRDEQDRVAYLRSVLAWIFRDIPGLSGLYREQIRGGSGNDAVSEMYRGLRNLNDVANGRKSLEDGVSDAFQQLRDVFDRATEQVRERYGDFTRQGDRSGGPDASGEEGSGEEHGEKTRGFGQGETVNDFLRGAEHTISEGLRQLGSFFENARKNAEQKAEPSPSEDEPDVSAEDESGTKIHVDIVEEDEDKKK